MEMIDIELTPRERQLILRYGYPFDQIKQPYWLSRRASALSACRSTNMKWRG